MKKAKQTSLAPSLSKLIIGVVVIGLLVIALIAVAGATDWVAGAADRNAVSDCGAVCWFEE